MKVTVSESIALLGIDAENVNGDLCFVAFTPKGARNYLYSEIKDKPLTRDLYLATGTFAPGTITPHTGRKAENVRSVLWLVLDCDLKDYLNESVDELRTWTDSELLNACKALAGDVRELLDAHGIKCHRIDYTGYGICVYIILEPNDHNDLETIRGLNAGLVEQVNATWGSTLADPAVHDSGTRVTRLAGAPNSKGSAVRQSETLYRDDGRYSIADLQKVITARTRTTVARAIPRSGNALPDEIAQNIVSAILPHWSTGNRHGLALAIGGILAKAGISEDDAARIVEFTANSAGDAELDDRLKAVATSYARARNGLQTRGLYGLRDWLPVEAVEYIDRELDKMRATSTVTFTVQDETLRETPSNQFGGGDGFTVLDIPECAKDGLVGEYIALVRPTTESSEGFHLGVFLTIVGAMMGRRISAEYGGTLYPNLYTLLVGTSGHSRKDTAIKKGITFLNTNTTTNLTQRRSGVALLTDVASAEGTIKALAEKPNTLMYISEFSRLMMNSERKGTAIIPVLIEAFDTPTVLSNSSLSNPIRAEYPYTSILAATQPRILESLMSDEHVHSGFINRWLIIPGKSDNPLPIPPKLDVEVMSALFEQVHAAITDRNDGTSLMFSVDGHEYWSEWYVANWHKERSEDAASMAVRQPVMAVKIALIYAILNGDDVITADHLRVAVAIIDWMWSHIERMLPGWGGTTQGRIEAKVMQFLADRGPVKRNLITQYCRSRTWSTDDLNRAVEAMVKGGMIAIDANGIVGMNV